MGLEAQQRFEMRKLQRTDPERLGNAHQRRAACACESVAEERRAHLDLEKHAEHGFTPPAGIRELGERRPEVEPFFLAARVELHRGARIGLAQVELPEHPPRRCNILFRNPPIRLRDMTHHAEGRAEERLAHGCEVHARTGASRRRVLVVQVTDNHPEQHAHRSPGQDIAQ